MNDEKKADGYVAWHQAINVPNQTNPHADMRSFGISPEHCEERMKPWGRPRLEIKDAGWRIRPVKLVFLDED